jgi:hypothetical protein
MKIRHASLILLSSATVLFATPIVLYDNAKPPTMSLPTGYGLAMTSLGSTTNQFHCISATISTDFGSPGWFFTFCATNTPPTYKWVTVEFDGRVHVEDIMLR